MSTPTDLRFTKSHEWVRIDGDTATVGISAYAQSSLGDVVYVDMPEEGDSFDQGDELAEIESVKAVSSIYAPVSGAVTAVNADLEDSPETVNEDPYGAGWLFKLEMSDASELDGMLNPAAYDAHTAEAG
jgi:glycine cleavage system H protein